MRLRLENPIAQVDDEIAGRDVLIVRDGQCFLLRVVGSLLVQMLHERQFQRMRPCLDALTFEASLENPDLYWWVAQVLEGHRHEADHDARGARRDLGFARRAHHALLKSKDVFVRARGVLREPQTATSHQINLKQKSVSRADAGLASGRSKRSRARRELHRLTEDRIPSAPPNN